MRTLAAAVLAVLGAAALGGWLATAQGWPFLVEVAA